MFIVVIYLNSVLHATSMLCPCPCHVTFIVVLSPSQVDCHCLRLYRVGVYLGKKGGGGGSFVMQGYRYRVNQRKNTTAETQVEHGVAKHAILSVVLMDGGIYTLLLNTLAVRAAIEALTHLCMGGRDAWLMGTWRAMRRRKV